MKHNRMRVKAWGRSYVALGLALGVCGGTACTAELNEPPSSETEQSIGRVRLALQTGSAQTFQLHGAVFDVKDRTGTSVLQLDSDDDAGAGELGAELPQGNYSIELAAGWALLRAGDDGSFSEVQAALATRNPLEFRVQHQRATELVYTFATDAGLVTLGRGSISVGLDVVDTAALTACQVLDPSTCPEGLTCLLANETGQAFCAQPGTLAVGAECRSEQCVTGAQCLRAAGEASGICKRFCDPNRAEPLCNCQSLSFDDAIGVCERPPACEPNCNTVPTFAFQDSLGDDSTPTALSEFFAALPPLGASDYLFFEITTGSSLGGAWCASHADFYVSNYLALASGGNVVFSGNWEKYARPSGGNWSAPDTSSYANYFGVQCASRPFDWCSEWGLQGQNLAIMPASTGTESQASGNSSGGDWIIKIAVGPSRASTCGF